MIDSPGADELAADRDWWNIYDTSFPLEERESREVILESVRSSKGMAFRVRPGGRTIAIATTHLLQTPPAAFLVYLAVDANYRDGGHGGRLLDYAAAKSADRLRELGSEPLGMIWEVDPPGVASDHAEEALRRRRIAFFQGRGGVLLPRAYWQPPLDGGAPVRMQLIFRPENDSPPPDPATVEALVRAMYFEKYGAMNAIPRHVLEELLLHV